MRVLLGLTALVFKYWLIWRMTARDAVILWIAAFFLLVFGLTIAGARNEKVERRGGPFCGSAPIDYDGFQSCEFGLRNARQGHFAPMRKHVG